MTAIEPDPLLASDTEREHAVERLNAAYAEGRLRTDEFSDRVSGALAARTRADLAALLKDLPPSDPPRPKKAAKRPLARRVGDALNRCLCCGPTWSPDRDADRTVTRT